MMQIKHACHILAFMGRGIFLYSDKLKLACIPLTSRLPMPRTDKKAMLREAGEYAVRLRQLAEQVRAETDERLTLELIAERRRFVESLEEAKAFWLKVLRNSLETKSPDGRA